MSVDKKNAGAPEPQAHDEIDEIMNEIQNLQQGMAETVAAAKPAAEPPKLKAVAPAPVVAETSNETEMEEFRGSGDDASLEETLASIKDETPPPSGQSLLDTVTAETQPETVEEGTEIMESLDAIAEAEAEIAADVAAESTVAQAEPQEAPVEEAQADEHPAEEASPEELRILAARTQEVKVQKTVTEEPRAEIIRVAPARKKTMEVEKDGCLTMTLSGQMTLKLKYEYEGQEVTIGFSDQTLQVQLSDGTEFKIPIGRVTAKAAAA